METFKPHTAPGKEELQEEPRACGVSKGLLCIFRDQALRHTLNTRGKWDCKDGSMEGWMEAWMSGWRDKWSDGGKNR